MHRGLHHLVRGRVGVRGDCSYAVDVTDHPRERRRGQGACALLVVHAEDVLQSRRQVLAVIAARVSQSECPQQLLVAHEPVAVRVHGAEVVGGNGLGDRGHPLEQTVEPGQREQLGVLAGGAAEANELAPERLLYLPCMGYGACVEGWCT